MPSIPSVANVEDTATGSGWAGLAVDPKQDFDALSVHNPWQVAFLAGTLIDTNLGPRRVERLARGDKVWTAETGYQPIRWIAARKVTLCQLQADPSLHPVCLRSGALGPGLPATDLYLSQQQRVCVIRRQAELLSAARDVLVPAVVLVNDQTVRIMPPAEDITYVQFLLDGRQIVRLNGVESENFCPKTLFLHGMDRRARPELAPRVF